MSENVRDKRTDVPGQGLNAPRDKDPARIKRNIKRMVDQGAPEEDIDAYLATEGVTPDALRGDAPAPQEPQSDDPRSKWSPEQKQAYQDRRKLYDDGTVPKPGYATRIAHSATLGAADEISAGIQTAIETPFAVLRGDREGVGDRFGRHMAEQAATLDVMREETDGGGGIAADVAGGFAMGVPKAVVAGGNAMLQAAQAPTRGQLSKDLIKYGATFGGAHAAANAEGGVVDRLSYVPEGMLYGAGGSLVFGHVLNKGLNAMARYRQGKAARNQENAERRAELEDAGVSDPLPAAVSGNAMADAATRTLGGTFVGGPIRQKAAENVGQLQGRFNAMLDAQTGGRSSDELGREAQGILEHQLTGRSIAPEDVAALSPEQLQDITGLPLPDAYKPRQVKVDPVAPRQVQEVTPDEYLGSLREGVQPVRPVYPPDEAPRTIFVDEFRQPDAPPAVNPEIASKRVELEQLRAKSDPETRAFAEEQMRLADDIERAGFEVDEWSNHGFFALRRKGMWGGAHDPIEYHPNGRPSLAAERGYEHKAVKVAGRRRFTGKGWGATEKGQDKARPFSTAAEDIRGGREAADPLAERFAAVRAKGKEIEQQRQRMAHLEREIAQSEADEVAAAEAARTTADERARAEHRRAVEIENERARTVNETNRAMAEDAAAAETERLRQEAVAPSRERAASAAQARTNQLRRQAEEEARVETARLQKEADEAQAREIEERRARAPARKPLGSVREHTYVTEADAGYEMGRRHTPNVQRNPMGASGRPSETSSLITTFATEARGSGRLPGFKGNVFDEAGNLKPDVRKLLADDLGEAVAGRLAYLVERRAKGQFPPGIKGLHDIRTLIGQELREAAKYREPGMARGANEAALSRLYKAFSKDIDAIRDVGPGGPAATRMRHDQDEDYGRLIEDLKRPLGQLFKEGVTPVQALDKLVAGAKKGDLELLRPYMKVMTDKADPTRASATIIQHVVRSEKDMAGVVKALGEIRPETRELLFAGKDGQEYRAALEKLEKAAKRLEPYVGLAKNKGGVLKQAVHPSTLVTAAAFYHQFWPALVTTAGAAAAAKFMASPRYLNWLTKVPQVTHGGLQGQDALRHLSRLTGITATDGEFGEPIMQAIGSMFMGSAQASEDDTEIEAQGPDDESDPQEVEPEHHSHYQPRDEKTGQFMNYGSQDRQSENMGDRTVDYSRPPRSTFDSALRQYGIGDDLPGVEEARSYADRGDMQEALRILEMRAWEDGWGGTDGGIGAINGVAQALGMGHPRHNEDPDAPDYSRSPEEMRQPQGRERYPGMISGRRSGNAMAEASGYRAPMRGMPPRNQNAMRSYGGR